MRHPALPCISLPSTLPNTAMQCSWDVYLKPEVTPRRAFVITRCIGASDQRRAAVCQFWQPQVAASRRSQCCESLAPMSVESLVRQCSQLGCCACRSGDYDAQPRLRQERAEGAGISAAFGGFAAGTSSTTLMPVTPC